MANFKVYGTDRESGTEVAQVIPAASAEEAERLARERGLLVSHIEPVPEPEARFDDAPAVRSPEPIEPTEPTESTATDDDSERSQPPAWPEADARDEEEDTAAPHQSEELAANAPRPRPDEPEPEPAHEPKPEPAHEPEGIDVEPEGERGEVPGDAPEAPGVVAATPAPPADLAPPAPPRDVTGPGDRWGTAWLAYLRISVGLLWLFELVLGGRWGLQATNDAEAGNTALAGWLNRRSDIAPGTIEQEAMPWIGWLYEHTFATHAELWGGLWMGLEALVVVSLLLGLLVRPVALLALIYSFVFVGLGDMTLGLMFAVAHLVMLATGGGRILSVDQMLLRRLGSTPGTAGRALRGLIELPILPRGGALVLAGLVLLAALYHVLGVVHVGVEAIRVTYLDLATLLTLSALALLVGARAFHQGGSVGDLVRIFVGYKLLDEILVRPDVNINALPGWAGSEAVAGTLEPMRDHHWPPIAEALEQFVLPGIDFWTGAFVVIQTLAGVLLLLGWRSRLAATLALLMMLVLVVFGFVGLAPFVLVYLIYVLAVGGGRMLAVDATLVPAAERARPVGWPRWLAVITGLAAIALLGFAGYVGVAPSAPLAHVAGYAALALAIPLIALTLIAWPTPPRALVEEP